MKESLRREAIIEWLCSHPLINYHLLCKKVGYDSSNLLKAMKGLRPIPDKYLAEFEKELAPYGFLKQKSPLIKMKGLYSH